MIICIVAFIKIMFAPVWGEVRIIDVLTLGGEGRMNFRFDKDHFFLMARQLYILNFLWLWAIILIVCIFVMAFVTCIRKKRR